MANSVCCEICGLRRPASGYEMGPTHAEREREREEAKYPSILGGRETREIRKERAGMRADELGVTLTEIA